MYDLYEVNLERIEDNPIQPPISELEKKWLAAELAYAEREMYEHSMLKQWLLNKQDTLPAIYAYGNRNNIQTSKEKWNSFQNRNRLYRWYYKAYGESLRQTYIARLLSNKYSDLECQTRGDNGYNGKSIPSQKSLSRQDSNKA
jgi:glucosamine 6-phosphate synthetase-like amidotransferase/phosphosugar isomerase protein